MKLEKQTQILRIVQEGKYWADESGIIYSAQNILGQRVTGNGYRMVTLFKVPERIDCLVHQFCYLFFKGGYSAELQINHIDGNKLNNALGNLEAVTASQNQIHSVRVLGNCRDQTGEKNDMAKLTWEQVRKIRLKHRDGETQRAIAEQYKVSYASINNIVLFKTWKEATC
jgi:hypothetical protein